MVAILVEVRGAESVDDVGRDADEDKGWDGDNCPRICRLRGAGNNGKTNMAYTCNSIHTWQFHSFNDSFCT